MHGWKNSIGSSRQAVSGPEVSRNVITFITMIYLIGAPVAEILGERFPS